MKDMIAARKIQFWWLRQNTLSYHEHRQVYRARLMAQRSVDACCDEMHLRGVQKKLESLGLAGTLKLCAHPPMPEPLNINETNKQNYLAEYIDTASDTRDAMQQLIEQHRVHITMSNFLGALKACVDQVNDWYIKNPDKQRVAIAILPGRSQKWVADLAMRFLSFMPDAVVELMTVSSNAEIRLSSIALDQIRAKNIKTIMLFDDMSFSGLQLRETLENIYAQFKGNVLTIVPYMTLAAQENVRRFIERGPACYELRRASDSAGPADLPEDARNMKLRMFFHQNLPSLFELSIPMKDKMHILKAAGNRLSIPHTEQECLAIFETSESLQKSMKQHRYIFSDWKIPDAISVEPFFVSGQVHGELSRFYGKDPSGIPSTRFIPNRNSVYAIPYGEIGDQDLEEMIYNRY